MTVPTTIEILRALSEHVTLMIFNLITTTNENNRFIKRVLNLTDQEFHSRISKLKRVELVTKVKGHYHSTSMGKVVYDGQLLLGIALHDYWKLVALDSICSHDALPMTERKKVVEQMAIDERLRNLFLKNLLGPTKEHLQARSHSMSQIHVTTDGEETYGK